MSVRRRFSTATFRSHLHAIRQMDRIKTIWGQPLRFTPSRYIPGSVLGVLHTFHFSDPREGRELHLTGEETVSQILEPPGGYTEGHLPCGVTSNEAQPKVKHQPPAADGGAISTLLSPPRRRLEPAPARPFHGG